MMNATADFMQRAIQAAKNQDWTDAIAQNQAILDQDPSDVQALIRLGVAHVQIGETKLAKKAFETALELDKSNVLVKKHLAKLKNHQTITLSSLPANEEFIEEPGKTKTVELHRLAGKDQLSKLSVGQVCVLRPKSRFISVEVENKYLGSLPEDLSARLTKLIKSGNEYVCYIQALSLNSCSVFLKEVSRAKANEFVNSFPVSKNHDLTTELFMADDTLPFQMDDVPFDVVSVDDEDDGRKSQDVLPIDDDNERERERDEERENTDTRI